MLLSTCAQVVVFSVPSVSVRVFPECSLTIWWQVITPVSVLITAQSRGGCVTRDSGQARDNHCDAETGPE